MESAVGCEHLSVHKDTRVHRAESRLQSSGRKIIILIIIGIDTAETDILVVKTCTDKLQTVALRKRRYAISPMVRLPEHSSPASYGL